MSEFDAKQVQALRGLLDSSAPKIATTLEVSLDESKRVVDSVHGLVVACSKEPVVQFPFFVVVRSESVLSGLPLDRNMVAVNAEHMATFVVDTKMKVLQILPGPADIKKFTSLMKEERVFAYVHASTFEFVVDEVVSDSVNVLEPGSAVLNVSAHPSRTSVEVPEIVEDHYRSTLHLERGARYWHDKPGRILMRGTAGTEDIFHRSLAYWLRTVNRPRDCARVVADPKGPGEDRIDIILCTFAGVSIKIELKWMGENERGTKYSEEVIDIGIEQMNLYLSESSEGSCLGFVVVYDGRFEGQSSVLSRPITMHKMCRGPVVRFLESESPSVRARAAVRGPLKRHPK